VFVLWLHNQRYYTRDVVGVKMTHRDWLMIDWLIIYLFKPQSSRTSRSSLPEGIHTYNYKVQHTRDLPYYEGIRAKIRCEYKLHENKHENDTSSLHTFGLSLFYPIVQSIGWFAIQWRVQLYTAHVIPVQSNMADRAWIPEVWRKPVSIFFVASYQVKLCCYSGYLT